MSGLWVGMWRASSQSTLVLFVLPTTQQFVFLVGSAPHRRSLLSGMAQHSASPSPGQRVQAFEVGWQGLVGLKYTNPLCSAGRLVLEARDIRRRTFKSVRKQGAVLQATSEGTPSAAHGRTWGVSQHAECALPWVSHPIAASHSFNPFVLFLTVSPLTCTSQMTSARQFYGLMGADAVPLPLAYNVPEQPTDPAQALPAIPPESDSRLAPPLAGVRPGPQRELFACKAWDAGVGVPGSLALPGKPVPPMLQHEWPPAASWTSLEQVPPVRWRVHG